MKVRHLFTCFLLLCIFSIMVYGEEIPLYLQSDRTPEQRAEDLLHRMTLQEKLGQLVQIDLGQIGKGESEPLLEKAIIDYGVGSMISGGSGSPFDNSPAGWAALANKMHNLSMQTRLKIPILYGVDAVHGHNMVKGATIYPYNLALAATFNKTLARDYATKTAEELAATGLHWTFAPVLDVARDPRWGRTHETLGEDPYTVAEMGRNLILGFQSNHKVIACAKHYLGYSGTNNGRDRDPADFSERTLREIHLPPYEAAIEAGIGSVMVNSGEVNGEPVHSSHYLLTEILKDQLGFKGFVVSDYEDIRKLYGRHKVAASLEDALSMSFNAGLDMNMEAAHPEVVDILEALVEEGKIPLARIDDAVRRILIIKFKLALFERKPLDPAEASRVVGSPASREIARTLAHQSMVLLRNPDQMLPLAKNISSILVVGPSADSLSRLCGGWTIDWQGAQERYLSGQTILAAIRQKVSPETRVIYLPDSSDLDAVKKAAKEASLILAVVGEKPYAEWLGDNESLTLPMDQQALLQTISEVGKPTVQVVIAGRPLLLPEPKTETALLWGFLPGTEGGPAIADILFGDVSPSGRLPLTFPMGLEQMPINYTVKQTVKYEPRFPFGFGLSYTKFAYSDIQAPEKVKTGEPVKVSITVKNVGSRAGEEVVMLYVRHENASVTQPVRRLQGFARVSLAPGESRTVHFQLSPRQLSILNAKMRWVQEPGRVGISIGGIGAAVKILP